MKDKVTISNIAELAKVSKTTVSFYLNGHFHKMSEQTRERIRQAIEDTGFQPNAAARSLNAKETRLLGVIIGDITSGFANQLIKGISDYARRPPRPSSRRACWTLQSARACTTWAWTVF